MPDWTIAATNVGQYELPIFHIPEPGEQIQVERKQSKPFFAPFLKQEKDNEEFQKSPKVRPATSRNFFSAPEGFHYLSRSLDQRRARALRRRLQSGRG
jgi:hypothetical protein